MLGDEAEVGHDQVCEASVGVRAPVDSVVTSSVRLNQGIIVQVQNVEAMIGDLQKKTLTTNLMVLKLSNIKVNSIKLNSRRRRTLTD